MMNSTNMKEKNIIRIIKNEEKFHEYWRNQYHSSTNKEKIKTYHENIIKQNLKHYHEIAMKNFHKKKNMLK